ncbi:MAG TPA: thioredoxin [Archaeoglobus veneficus]|nr:thioredoxin [Archaeoglobus veneficus]
MDELEKIRKKKLEEMMRKMTSEKKSEKLSKPIELNSKNFSEVLKNENVVIDFYANWCAPCKMIAPIIEELAKEYAGKVVFAKLNTDENIEIAQRFAISAIPTIIFFKNGKAVDQIVGALPKAELKRWIEKNIYI